RTCRFRPQTPSDSTLFPYTTLFRSQPEAFSGDHRACTLVMEGMARGFDDALPWIGRVFFYMPLMHAEELSLQDECVAHFEKLVRDRKSTRLNSSHVKISYAVFCLKK